MYNPRRISNLDRFCNFLVCQPEEQLNPTIDWIQQHYDCFIINCILLVVEVGPSAHHNNIQHTI